MSLTILHQAVQSGHHAELRYGWGLHSTFSKILDGSS